VHYIDSILKHYFIEVLCFVSFQIYLIKFDIIKYYHLHLLFSSGYKDTEEVQTLLNRF
jgi:hypothetical protein